MIRRSLTVALLVVAIIALQGPTSASNKAPRRIVRLAAGSLGTIEPKSDIVYLREKARRDATRLHLLRSLRQAEKIQQAAQQTVSPPVSYSGSHEALWLCIHSYEGSWTDPNAPYFGGLQMGYTFMEAYGGSLYATKGTADHWTPDEQIGVAESAWKVNGYSITWLYSQWPVSGPDCT